MKKLILLFSIITLIVVSCKKDDDKDDDAEITKHEIRVKNDFGWDLYTIIEPIDFGWVSGKSTTSYKPIMEGDHYTEIFFVTPGDDTSYIFHENITIQVDSLGTKNWTLHIIDPSQIILEKD